MTLQPTPLEAQMRANRHDPLRILVVGAGIAGLTAAQLLRGAGLHPIVVERSGPEADHGYMLALMPMVDAALRDLSAWKPYREQSVPLSRYRFRSHTGRPVRTDSMAAILREYGDYRGISRGRLVEVLTHDDCPVTLRATVTQMREHSEAVDVTIATEDRSTHTQVDAVVIADGISSHTRALVLDESCAHMDTGWGGWVVWGPAPQEKDLGEEVWGAGFFIGLYPVLGHDGVFLGGPAEATRIGPEAFVSRVRSHLRSSSPRIANALEAVTRARDPFYWRLQDVRAPHWSTARTVLLGDAAAGFLPTAGIGAGMAMESAWVLATMLRTALAETALGSQELASIFSAYERIQRPRVETAQDTSRSLARLMFSKSKAVAVGREWAFRVLSVDQALRPIQRLLASPPRPVEASEECLAAGAPHQGRTRQ